MSYPYLDHPLLSSNNTNPTTAFPNENLFTYTPVSVQDTFLTFSTLATTNFLSSTNPSLPTSPYMPWPQTSTDSFSSQFDIDFGLNPFFHPAQLYENHFFTPTSSLSSCHSPSNLLHFTNCSLLPITPEAVSPDQILSPPVPSSPKSSPILILPSQLNKQLEAEIKRESSPDLSSDPISEPVPAPELVSRTPARSRVRLNRDAFLPKKETDKPTSEPKILHCPHPGCPKTFTRVYSLHSHICTHSNLRPFKCDKCPAAFSRNHDLKRHQKIHLGVKPFHCNKCDRNFSRMDALGRHRQNKPQCWLSKGRAK